jgi:galactoside O-acetyltransferase
MNLMKNILKEIFEFYIWFLSVIPTAAGNKLRYYAYRPLFKKAGKFTIDTGVTIKGFENIEIGNNVYVLKNSYLYAFEGGQIIIGNNCSFNSNVMVNAAPGKITIGDGCAVGPNTVIRAADHNFDDVNVPIKKQPQQYGEIFIDNGVWIAANCVITSGTTIGSGSVVAAGAVVTKDVEPYCVVGGVPAKLIKKRE